MNVEKIMTRKVAACRPTDTLENAARIMWENDCGCVPVVNDEKVVGMITDRDICMSAWTQDARLSELHVSRACSERVYTCGPHDSITAAEETMRTHQVRRLPVVDQNRRLVGILSLNDISRSTAKGAAQPVAPHEIAETLAQVGRPRQTARQQSEEAR